MIGIFELCGMWIFLRKLNFGFKGLYEEKLCIFSGVFMFVFYGIWDW